MLHELSGQSDIWNLIFSNLERNLFDECPSFVYAHERQESLVQERKYAPKYILLIWQILRLVLSLFTIFPSDKADFNTFQ